jgi:phosphoglycerate dehydrogenase-like enzyme
MTSAGMTHNNHFRVGFSADFLNEQRQPVFPDIGLDLLDAESGLEYEFLAACGQEYAPEQISSYDVLISLKPRVTANSLEGVTRLCAIGRCGVGYDNVDLNACTERDIAVYITPQGVIRSMAESIVLFILALSHDLVGKDRLVRAGKWSESTRRLGSEARGKTIGSIGFGGIAREAYRLLKPFDAARRIAFDPYIDAGAIREAGAEPVELDEIFRASDFVLVNCPLNRETRHLVDSRRLAMMKPSAFLINTARGAIVDEAALVRTLRECRIAGAALDVFETEPLPANSPLLELDNVIVTSHSVGWTEELFRDMGRIDCEGALAIMRGLAPPNVVNREVLERPGFRFKLERFRLKLERYRDESL